MTLYVEDSFVYIHFFSNFMPFVLAARRKSDSSDFFFCRRLWCYRYVSIGEDIGIDVLYVISKI